MARRENKRQKCYSLIDVLLKFIYRSISHFSGTSQSNQYDFRKSWNRKSIESMENRYLINLFYLGKKVFGLLLKRHQFQRCLRLERGAE